MTLGMNGGAINPHGLKGPEMELDLSKFHASKDVTMSLSDAYS